LDVDAAGAAEEGKFLVIAGNVRVVESHASVRDLKFVDGHLKSRFSFVFGQSARFLLWSPR